MIDDYSVVINYKNKKLEDVGRGTYSLGAYTVMLSSSLKNCLNDVEESFRKRFGENCDLRQNEEFMNIRRQLLNTANAIERLPDVTYYKGTSIKAIKASDYIADVVNNM